MMEIQEIHALHHLSLCGRVVSLHCKRASSGNTGDACKSNGSEILLCSLQFNTEQNSFLEAGDVSVLHKTRSASADIVTCACVYDLDQRLTTPFVLLKTGGNKQGSSYKYRLLALSSSVKRETKMTFKLPYQLVEKVYIVHGPLVLWTHAGVGFYTSALDVGAVKPTPTPWSRPIIGLLPLHKGDVFIIGPMANQFKKCLAGTEILGHKLTSESHIGSLLVSGDVFDATVMLPHAYVSITQAVLVLGAEKTDGVLTKSSVLTTTSEKQLVYFEDGVPKDVCQLPFDAPEDIHVVDTGRHGLLIAVCFDQGHVCAVWRDTFQVAARWSAVRSVHVDDFLRCGTEQLLLVFEEDDGDDDNTGGAGRPLDNFLITDLCGITFSSGQRNNRVDAASHPAGDNYLLTFQALESRLQSGLTVVQSLQQEVRLKQRVLLQATQALTDMVSGRDPVLMHHEQEGLFSLWDDDDEDHEACSEVCNGGDGKEEEQEEEKMQGVTSEAHTVSSRPLRVERLWHRFAEGHLVVGVVLLIVDRSVPVDGVSLSIQTTAGPGSAPAVIQTRSQVFRLTASPTASLTSGPPEPAAKRSRGEEEEEEEEDGGGGGEAGQTSTGPRRVAVTAVTPVTSLLSGGRVVARCPVMLHYVRGQAPPVDTGPPTRHGAFQCGQVAVDIRTDFYRRLLPTNLELTTEEDLLSGLSVLEHWVFHVDSPHHGLGDMEHWMQRATPCHRLKVNPRYLVANSEGPSGAMLLRWSPASRFRGELSVHASQLQTLQFLESLSHFLLASCTIRPLKDSAGPLGEASSSSSSPRLLSLALENEAIAIKRAATSLLLRGGEEEARRGGGAPPEAARESADDDDEGQRSGHRQEWERDLGWSRRSLSAAPVDTAHYCNLTRRLSAVRLEADLAALLQARRGAS